MEDFIIIYGGSWNNVPLHCRINFSSFYIKLKESKYISFRLIKKTKNE